MSELSNQELIALIQHKLEENERILNAEKALSKELHEVNEKLLQSEHLKSNFLSNIRNEINNPLSSILQFSKILSEGKLDIEAVKKYAALIYLEAFDLDFQLRNIFLSAEIEAGEASLQVSQIQIVPFVQGVVNLFNEKIAKKQQTLLVKIDVPEDLLWYSDNEKLNLILSNLLANAITFNSEAGKIEIVDIETRYVDHVKKNFDLDAISNSGLNLVYDAMYGAGQRVMPLILPKTQLLHCDHNPSFRGQAPEPIAKNLQELEAFIKADGTISCALATDGDADRIGLYNGKGEFIDSHHIILLLIHYMVKYKQMTGKVVIAFSVTPRVEKLCAHYGLEIQTTKIGFKEIASIMIKDDVLIGGEESGGIAVKGHIPERDGIWMGLIIWEFMAKSGKTLDELIDEVYEIVGPFKFERNDLHITEDLKQKIIANCKGNNYTSFGKYEVSELKTIDGFKYFFDDKRWVMIRPSGTEPVLRTYAEAPTLEEVREILKATEETICQ